MASTYSGNLGLNMPAFGDTGWDVSVNGNTQSLDTLAPIGGLAVRPVEIPSASLNVKVAAGVYPNSDGSNGTYLGTASQAMPPSATTLLWLDATGTLTLGASYPTSSPYVPLAKVVAGTTAISSITDNRVPGGLVLRSLFNAVNDAAAAAGGVAIGGLYRNANAVQIRLV